MKTAITIQILESGLIKTKFNDNRVNSLILSNWELNKSFAKVIHDLQNFYTDNLAEDKYKTRVTER